MRLVFRLLTSFLLVELANSYISSDYGVNSEKDKSIEESNWVDETEIRQRLSQITQEKFSHHYHERPVCISNLLKRSMR
uniref:Uncharacterized protein n=1 Tax=Caenorhabditis japonica TaxID=281687 RepID=A0A8R1J2W7_CAEJA